MAFFLPRTVYHTRREAPVSPLYRLLSDMDRLSRRSAAPEVCYVYRAPVVQRPWNPHFNVQETSDEYILRSQLPGLTKEDISVDFPEAQKLVIRGRQVEGRPQPGSDSTSGPASAPHAEVEEAATPEPVSPVSDDARSRSSFQATVEDAAEEEDDDFDVVSEFEEKHEEHQPAPEQQAKPEPQPQSQPKPTAQAVQPAEPQQPAPAPRVVREFSRTFTFPGPVNYDATTADLKDGLLTIVVPKPFKPEPRRIVIN